MDLERTTDFFIFFSSCNSHNSLRALLVWNHLTTMFENLWVSPKATQKTPFRFCYSFSPPGWKSSLLRVPEGCEDMKTS